MKSDIEKQFQKARARFPHTKNVVYFNTASYGPFSTDVQKVIEENIRIRMACEYDDSHDTFQASEDLRKIYASLIGAKTSQIGIGLNTTHGLNVAAFGLPLNEGDEVLVSDIEFPAVVYTWRAAAERRKLKLTFVPSVAGGFNIEQLEKAITKKTKVLSLSWVQFFNGYKNDLKALAKICKKHKIWFVVDGIQGMGVEPINVRSLGIDIFTSGCQKWMLAPQGCGFFYLSDDVMKVIEYPFMSWLGVDWKMKFSDLFHYDREYFKSARTFEMGYYVTLNLLAMRASAQLFADLGIKNIQQHNYELIDELVTYLDNNPFYSVTSSREKKHRSSIMTFTCEKYRDLHALLVKNKIICVPREGSVRIAVHLFNNHKDIKRLIGFLDMFAGKHA